MINIDYLEQLINSIQVSYDKLKKANEEKDMSKINQLKELINSFSNEINKILEKE